MKNIALFIDGTWNEMVSEKSEEEYTNVARLYEATVSDSGQITRYFNGVGTRQVTPQGEKIVIPYRPHKVLGGGFGLGLSEHIKDAYQFLSNTYQHNDNVYLFGFSRGAFAARSLAGFADAVGLLLAGTPDTNAIELAYAHYENGTDPRLTQFRRYLHDMTGREGPRSREEELPIYLIGVWDTVGALGLSGFPKRLTAPFTQFHRTELPANVTNGRHALALHENRGLFPPLLWQERSSKNPNQSLEQRWFNGAHADVGGGYQDHEWSDLALNWMAKEASDLGLRLDSKWGALPDRTAGIQVHNARNKVWRITSFGTRKNFVEYPDPPKEVHKTFTVDPSVTKRLMAGPQRYTFYKKSNEGMADMDKRAQDLHLKISYRGGPII